MNQTHQRALHSVDDPIWLSRPVHFALIAYIHPSESLQDCGYTYDAGKQPYQRV